LSKKARGGTPFSTRSGSRAAALAERGADTKRKGKPVPCLMLAQYFGISQQ
jgi:hypothetical protein